MPCNGLSRVKQVLDVYSFYKKALTMPGFMRWRDYGASSLQKLTCTVKKRYWYNIFVLNGVYLLLLFLVDIYLVALE